MTTWLGTKTDRHSSPKRRKLSDEELDSGDDDDRRDRLEDDDADMEEDRAPKKDTYRVSVNLARHGIPKGSDGEACITLMEKQCHS